MSGRVNNYEKADLISDEGSNMLNIHSNNITAGDVVDIGEYQVKAIESNHDIKRGSLLYVITQDNKNIFYATDTQH